MLLAVGLVAPLLLIPMVFIGGCLAVDRIASIDSLSTCRAPGLTDEKFARVKAGMTTEEVRQIIGEPLRYSGREWWYTRPKEPVEDWGTWNARYLIVNLNGVVMDVRSHKVFNH